MRYLARVSYDGSKFWGFQRLNNGKGVQNELERALKILAGKPILVHGAGRTDCGVHALDQCIHFDLDLDISPNKLQYVLNRLLSPYVAIEQIKKVDPCFHARFNVVSKTYQYKIYLGKKNPFYMDYAYCYYQSLDFDLMKQCAQLFLGKHDFHNFVAGKRDSYDAVITGIDLKKEGDFLIINITGPCFYRYMVRHIVGVLLDVGKKSCSIDKVSLALSSSQKITCSVVPPQGLYLMRIVYDVLDICK